MRFTSFASSSKANCFYIENKDVSFLIDAGISRVKVQEHFHMLQINSKKLQGILLTHEHDDHVRHLRQIASFFDVPVYLTKESLEKSKIKLRNYHIISPDQDLFFGDLHVNTFQVKHDANMCLGFLFRSNNKVVFFASDIGSYDKQILEKAYNADFIGIESNYEPSLLATSKYPQRIKDRISSNFGHLSNHDAAYFVKQSAGLNTKNVMFLHVSENSNSIVHLERMIDQDLVHALPTISYRIADRHNAGALIDI